MYFRPMPHFCCLSLISRLSWVLWAPMLSRSAAVWSTDYFSISSYEELMYMCTGLRWNKRSMQEKITSIGIRVCDNTWCVSTVSVSVDSCGWFKANFKILSIRLTIKTLSNLGRWVGGNGLGTGQYLGVNILVSAVLAS